MDDAHAASPFGLRDSDIASAMRLANANAAMWAIGNGLISTLLVIYLASDLGASGLSLSLILAAPRFAGLLRLGVPALMARLRARKAVCIAAYVTQLDCLVRRAGRGGSCTIASTVASRLRCLLSSWCLYHVTEYVGTVTLWSWLGDLTPANIRGQLLGRREFWLTAGRLGGLVTSAGLATLWRGRCPAHRAGSRSRCRRRSAR